jgi:transposase
MITRPHTRHINISRKVAHCPRCDGLSKRHSVGRRRLHEVGVSRPALLCVTYSKHYCERCRKHFSQPMEHIAPPGSRYTTRARRTAVTMVVARAMTLEQTARRMRQKYFVSVPVTTIHDWVVAEIAA